MPMYDYRCPSCGHQFEQLMKMDSPPPACPRCGEGTERQLVVATYGKQDLVNRKGPRFRFNYMEP